MLERRYTFNERYEMSQGQMANTGIAEILMKNIPGALSVHQAGAANDRSGVDWWVELSNGHHIGVDVKIRETDWAKDHPDEDDLALETFSVVDPPKIGWTRDATKRTDYILWLWPTGRWCLIPFPMLCMVFSRHWEDWRKIYKTKQQVTPSLTGSYRSECVFAPREVVWSEICRVYAGRPVRSPKLPPPARGRPKLTHPSSGATS